MRLPTEILLRILEYVVQDLPFSDVFRTRLVNTIFANEIFSLLLQTSRIEDDGFGKKHNRQHGQRYWNTFPSHLKHKYLNKKIKDFPISKCVFTHQVLEMLETLPDEEVNNKEIRDKLLRKIFDVTDWGRKGFEHLLYPENYSKWHDREFWYRYDAKYSFMMHHRPDHIRKCAQNTLLYSAIKLEEYNEICKLLKNGAKLAYRNRFTRTPLLIYVATRGSREVISTLHKYATQDNDYTPQYIAYAMAFSAYARNKDVLNVWIEQPLGYTPQGEGPWDFNIGLEHAMWKVAASGDIEMINFILERYQGDLSILRFNGFVQAARSGQKAAMEHFINLGGFDLNGCSQQWPKGALYTVLHRSNLLDQSKTQILRLMLEKGISLEASIPGVLELPLYWALKKQDENNLQLVEVLLEYGVDVNAKLHPTAISKLGYHLLLALRKNNLPAMRLLLEKGADPNLPRKRKTLLKYARHGKSVDEVKKILIETGWAEIVEEDNKWLKEKSIYCKKTIVAIGESQFFPMPG